MLINWQNIETVLLDMDGTLLDLHFDNFFWLQHLPLRYSQHHGIDELQATEQLYQKFNQKRGSLDWYCLDYWSKQLQLDIVSLKKEIQHLIAERPFVQDFLDHLKNHNIKSILVTNAHPDSLDLKLSLTGIGAKIDQIISSHSYKAPKESPLFWDKLHHETGFNPRKTLFIDDSEDILDSAKQFGIDQLIAINQPDSRQIANKPGRFPAITHFNELLPA